MPRCIRQNRRWREERWSRSHTKPPAFWPGHQTCHPTTGEICQRRPPAERAGTLPHKTPPFPAGRNRRYHRAASAKGGGTHDRTDAPRRGRRRGAGGRRAGGGARGPGVSGSWRGRRCRAAGPRRARHGAPLARAPHARRGGGAARGRAPAGRDARRAPPARRAGGEGLGALALGAAGLAALPARRGSRRTGPFSHFAARARGVCRGHAPRLPAARPLPWRSALPRTSRSTRSPTGGYACSGRYPSGRAPGLCRTGGGRGRVLPRGARLPSNCHTSFLLAR